MPVNLPAKLNIYMASDFAVSEPESEASDPDYTEHGVFGVDGNDNLFVLDWRSMQATADVWIDSLLDLWAEHKPLAWFGEAGVIRRAVEPFLKKRCRERKVYCRVEWIASIADKATRGRAFQARSAMGKVIFPAAQPWAERVIDQCVSFPGGRHDDKFDVLSLMCLAIDQAHPAIVASASKKPRDRWRDDERGTIVAGWKTV